MYLASACACSEYAQDEQAARADEAKAARAAGGANAGDDETPATREAAAKYNEMEAGESRRAKLIDSPFGASDDDPYSPPSTKASGSQASKSAYGAGDDGNPFANSSKSRGGAYN